MKYLHSMIRVKDLEKSLNFFKNVLGLEEQKRSENEKGRFTLVFLGTKTENSVIELTYNWDQPEDYYNGTNFGHLAFSVENIYELCQKISDCGIVINRPPRDGRMAFIKSPDQISIELLQRGDALEPCEPWLSMENQGSW